MERTFFIPDQRLSHRPLYYGGRVLSRHLKPEPRPVAAVPKPNKQAEMSACFTHL